MSQTAVSEETSVITEQYKKFIGRKVTFILVLIPILFILSGLSASLGSANISIWDAYSAFFCKFFPGHFEYNRLADICVWKLRLPRILMGILAGAGLGVAGAVMQAVLKNPLASPYTLGIASGAGFGASLAILMGAGFIGGQYLVIGNAFVFALLVSFVILGLSSRRGSTPESMILAGIAMMFLFNAMTMTLQYFGEADAVKGAIFWMVGSLGRATWDKLLPVLVVLGLCIPPIIIKSWDLNVLGAGDETAKSLGVRVELTRVIMMVLASLLVAGIVCFTGTIQFIGLVAPHICRMVIGGDNRFLIPTSGLVGAVLLVAADTVARTIMSPIILPVGVMTSYLGVPLFIYLIMKRKGGYF
jgi:iron complex transport system permease protein